MSDAFSVIHDLPGEQPCTKPEKENGHVRPNISVKRQHKKNMLRTIYPYVGIIQIRFWVQTIQPVLSLLTASSPFARHYSAYGRKMQ